MTTTTLTWQEQGNCWDTDPTLFFTTTCGAWPAAVFAICDTCPVTQQCLDYALEHFSVGYDKGIWGGTTARQRRDLRKERAA